MDFHFDGNGSFTAALAIAAGVVGQLLGQHLRLPGIVLLLLIGVGLGPDGANVVQPEALGSALPAIVGLAVAVILFEGGMSLNLAELRRQGRAIQQLISLGALVSLLVGSLSVGLALGWTWQLCVLFGSLVIVTGPTVVTPLLRRLNANHKVSTVLEAEGVLIDAVGAITAAVALEFVVAPTGVGAALAVPTIVSRLLFGILFGGVAGVVLGGLLRFRGIVPRGFENIIVFGCAVLVFETANAVFHESGIAAVTIAGLVVGNLRGPAGHRLVEFQEQLTVMLIGMLFVLLVADVRMAEIAALGWPGAIVAVACIVLVRPLSVFAGTFGTDLSLKEKVFIAWIGPRGIVAAAVASLFGYELARAGIEGGDSLRALVFLVIAVTVVWSALTGGLMAWLLGVRRKAAQGWMLVGANPLGRALAALLQEKDVEVVLLDQDEEKLAQAEALKLPVVRGNALSSKSHQEAALSSRVGALAITANEDVNYVFGEKARLSHPQARIVTALTNWESGVTREMVSDFGGEVLFATAADVRRWCELLETEQAHVEWWSVRRKGKNTAVSVPARDTPPHLALVMHRRKRCEPVTERTRLRKGVQVAFLVESARATETHAELSAAGWAQ